jgi:hypothetical protein
MHAIFHRAVVQQTLIQDKRTCPRMPCLDMLTQRLTTRLSLRSVAHIGTGAMQGPHLFSNLTYSLWQLAGCFYRGGNSVIAVLEVAFPDGRPCHSP